MNFRGAVLSDVELDAPLFKAMFKYGMHGVKVQLVSAGEQLVMLSAPGAHRGGQGFDPDARIYMIEPRTGNVRLAWREPKKTPRTTAESRFPIANQKSAVGAVVAKGVLGHFHLEVEHLVDYMVDFDIRKFTVGTEDSRTVHFKIGTSGVETKSEVYEDTAGRAVLDVVLVHQFVGNDLHRFVKFSRGPGGSMGSNLGAQQKRELSGVLDLVAESGDYELGKTYLLGFLSGQEVTLRVL